MKVELKVTGMHCPHCENKVTKALCLLEGVENASADHVGEKVEVEFDESKIDLKQLKKTIKKSGFKVR